jgi:hypothetical protein
MSPSRRRPTSTERDDFLLKLIAFRGTLGPIQQRMLDAMAVTAFCERPQTTAGYRDLAPADLRPRADESPWVRTYATLADD